MTDFLIAQQGLGQTICYDFQFHEYIPGPKKVQRTVGKAVRESAVRYFGALWIEPQSATTMRGHREFTQWGLR